MCLQESCSIRDTPRPSGCSKKKVTNSQRIHVDYKLSMQFPYVRYLPLLLNTTNFILSLCTNLQNYHVYKIFRQ